MSFEGWDHTDWRFMDMLAPCLRPSEGSRSDEIDDDECMFSFLDDDDGSKGDDSFDLETACPMEDDTVTLDEESIVELDPSPAEHFARVYDIGQHMQNALLCANGHDQGWRAWLLASSCFFRFISECIWPTVDIGEGQAMACHRDAFWRLLDYLEMSLENDIAKDIHGHRCGLNECCSNTFDSLLRSTRTVHHLTVAAVIDHGLGCRSTVADESRERIACLFGTLATMADTFQR